MNDEVVRTMTPDQMAFVELYKRLKLQHDTFSQLAQQAIEDGDSDAEISATATTTGLGLAMASLYLLKKDDPDWLAQVGRIDAASFD